MGANRFAGDWFPVDALLLSTGNIITYENTKSKKILTIIIMRSSRPVFRHAARFDCFCRSKTAFFFILGILLANAFSSARADRQRNRIDIK